MCTVYMCAYVWFLAWKSELPCTGTCAQLARDAAGLFESSPQENSKQFLVIRQYGCQAAWGSLLGRLLNRPILLKALLQSCGDCQAHGKTIDRSSRKHITASDLRLWPKLQPKSETGTHAGDMKIAAADAHLLL